MASSIRKAWRKKKQVDGPVVVQKKVATSEERYRELLEQARADCDRGNFWAVRRAMFFCAAGGLPLPRWLVQLIDIVLLCAFNGKKGPAKWVKKYKSDGIDYFRYMTVLDCRDRGVKWSDVYAEAAELLKGNPGGGTEDAIERSYKLVIRRTKEDPARYLYVRFVNIAPKEVGTKTAKISPLH